MTQVVLIAVVDGTVMETKLFRLTCLECGASWDSDTADVYECPFCGGVDVTAESQTQTQNIEAKNG